MNGTPSRRRRTSSNLIEPPYPEPRAGRAREGSRGLRRLHEVVTEEGAAAPGIRELRQLAVDGLPDAVQQRDEPTERGERSVTFGHQADAVPGEHGQGGGASRQAVHSDVE